MKIETLKRLINKEELERAIEINSDAYGGAAVQVAVNIMHYLESDEFKGEFNIGYSPDMTTAHGICCHCDDQGGITGFMAGAARNTVALCHELGWQYYLSDVVSEYDLDAEDRADRLAKYVDTVSKEGTALVDSETADEFIMEMIERHQERKAVKKLKEEKKMNMETKVVINIAEQMALLEGLELLHAQLDPDGKKPDMFEELQGKLRGQG